jgi:glycerol-3-phosphate acyltransferase PlsY
VATALGVLLAISPWLGLLIMLTWALVFVATKYSSLAAIVAAILLPIYAASLDWFEAYRDYEIVFIFLAVMLVWRHRTNIQKLLNGTESGFGKKKP